MGKAASVVLKMVEAFDGGDVEGAIEYFAPDATFTNPVASCDGRDEIRSLFQAFVHAFPDIAHTPKNVVDGGDRAAIEFVTTATHTGTLMSPSGEIPATGKSIELWQGTFANVADGKIVEFRRHWDTGAFMQQLGLMPEPAAATA